MKSEGTRLLKRSDVAALLGIDECIAAVDFDSTGVALQDAVAADAVCERTLAPGKGTLINLAG